MSVDTQNNQADQISAVTDDTPPVSSNEGNENDIRMKSEQVAFQNDDKIASEKLRYENADQIYPS